MRFGGSKSVRPSAVAGRFYPGNEHALQAEVDRLIGESPAEAKAIAVMAPHAGYVYSGQTAGRVFAAVEIPNRVVVMCPNHTGRGETVSVWSTGSWKLPTGQVPIDEDLAERILGSHPAFKADTQAHLREHAIEVELPFLYARNPNFRFVAIAVSRLDCQTLVELGQALAGVIKDLDEPVLIVSSSDMSHYIPADTAAKLDRLALDRFEALDPEGLYDVVERNQISMCGVMPSTIALAAAVALGATESNVIDYTHSGMVTGDNSAVVAYAGAVVA